MKIIIIIPAYNEEKNIRDIIVSCKLLGYNNIIVIDDGSNDKTAQIAREAGADVLSHMVNRGPGAATQTGLDAAKLLGADVAVTLDADGQHNLSDIKLLIDTLVNQKKDLVIGSRFLDNRNHIPLLRRLFNYIANIITFCLAGVYLTDTQSGLKALSRKALEKICITANGYEFCSEIIREAKYYKLDIIEIPVSVIYTPYSLSKGQNLSTGLTTVFKLIVRTLMR
jgi:glycosyltransferase involved in cell wall biosynthesis